MPFNVMAVGSDQAGLAASGNSAPALLLVSVTNEKNEPVEGLKAPDFTISKPTTRAIVEFRGLNDSRVPGVYKFEVTLHNLPWSRGQYPFAILVKRTLVNLSVQGQTLVVLEIR